MTAHRTKLLGTQEDIFGSGCNNVTNDQKIEEYKRLGLDISLFTKQDSFPVSTDDFDCEATAILGQRGQGKSNTVTRIIEQLHPKNIGTTIFDVEGEYYSLKSSYEVICVGSGINKHYDIQLDQVSPYYLAKKAVEDKLTVVLDFSEVDEDIRLHFSYDYMKSLLDICSDLKNEGRPTQHILVIEEVQAYAPEDGIQMFMSSEKLLPNKVKKLIRDIAQRGRKRGIGIIIASQRSQAVDKGLLSQCDRKILHKVTLPNDVSVYDKIMGGAYSSDKFREYLTKMQPGDAFAYFSDSWNTVHVLPQDTVHMGYSPKITYASKVPQVSIQKVNDQLIKDILSGSTLSKAKKDTPLQQIMQKYETQITRLTTQVDALKNLNKDQQDTIHTLKGIRVNIDSDAAQVIAEAIISKQTVEEVIDVSSESS